MGVMYSTFEILSNIAGEETVTETSNKGGTIVTKRRNPLIAGLTVTAVTCIVVVYIDGGKGMISKSLGRVCVKCSQA